MKSIEVNQQKSVATWLFCTAGLVFIMILVGAITRLTESGLSMAEWRPLIGALPPLNDAEWARVFDIYKQTPEFQKINFWMGIDDFKNIFFWEWFHRLLGRLIGIAYALPLLYFWLKNKISHSDKPFLLLLLILGGCQGLMGWYMVQSGLVDEPAVSHYRLAAHLGLALLIFNLLIWMGLRYTGFERKPDAKLYGMGWAVLGLLGITVFWGAYVAGLDAGKIYNEWPLMGGRFIPADMWHLSPAWINIFENHAAVQFTHRWLAIASMTAIIIYVLAAYKGGFKGDKIFTGLKIMVLLQVIMGITTLLSNVWIPVAAAHQGGGAILLGLMTASLYRVKPK